MIKASENLKGMRNEFIVSSSERQWYCATLSVLKEAAVTELVGIFVVVYLTRAIKEEQTVNNLKAAA